MANYSQTVTAPGGFSSTGPNLWLGHNGVLDSSFLTDVAISDNLRIYNDPSLVSSTADFKQWGFSVPSGMTIQGLEVLIERRQHPSVGSAGNIRDYTIQLLDATGSPTGSNKAVTAENWPTSDTNIIYGGPTDTWGASLSPSILNDRDFGVRIRIQNTSGGNRRGEIDFIQLKAYYADAQQKNMLLTGVG